MTSLAINFKLQQNENIYIFPSQWESEIKNNIDSDAAAFCPNFEQITAGSFWEDEKQSKYLQAQNKTWKLFEGQARPCWLASGLLQIHQPKQLTLVKENLSLAWITLSDKGSRGAREDKSGPVIEELARKQFPLCLTRGHILPDESTQLRALLVDLALTQKFDLIFTTGGTGVGPRDISPEATLAVLDKRLPGFEQAMTAASLAKTPHGMISRAVAGTLGGSLIINLPGSPKAVRENLEAVLPAVAHTVAKLQGDPSDCAKLRS